MAAPDLYEDGRFRDEQPFHEDERSIGQLFSELAAETRMLIRQEVELAKTEMTEKAARVGKDAGMMGAGGILMYTGALVLLAALVIGLGHLMGYGLAALLVGIVLTGAGAAMAMSARKDLKRASLSPDRTKRTVEETKLWLKEQTR